MGNFYVSCRFDIDDPYVKQIEERLEKLDVGYWKQALGQGANFGNELRFAIPEFETSKLPTDGRGFYLPVDDNSGYSIWRSMEESNESPD